MTDAYLTPCEMAKFSAARRKFLLANAAVAIYSILLVVASHFVDLNEYLWEILPGVFALTINVIVRSWPYKCPRCNKPPTVQRLSFGDEVSASGAIAINPKKCTNCKVNFSTTNDH